MKKSQLKNIIREVIKEAHYSPNHDPGPTSPIGCQCTHAFGHPVAKKVAWEGVRGYGIQPGSSLQPYQANWANVTVNGRKPQVGDVVFLRSATNTCTGAKIHPPDSQQPWFNGNNHQIIKVTYKGGCVGEWFSQITTHPDGSQTSADGSPYNGQVFTLPSGEVIGGAVIDYRTIPKDYFQDPEVPKTKSPTRDTYVGDTDTDKKFDKPTLTTKGQGDVTTPLNPEIDPEVDRMQDLANIKRER